MTRGVLLDDEAKSDGAGRCRRALTRRLASAAEVSFAAILGELSAGARLRASASPDCHAAGLGGLRLLLRGLAAGGHRFSLRAHGALLSGAFLEAGPKPRHQIEHAAVWSLFIRLLELWLLALHLRLDDAHQIGAILVGIAARIDRLGEIGHQLLGHLQLLGANGLATREVELARIDELVG